MRRTMPVWGGLALAATIWMTATASADRPMGLPEVSVPADNPITPEKVTLGEKLFNDQRFSTTGEVSCSTCHKTEKAFTDSPLRVSEGINKLAGTRNAPTVVNAAYMKLMFWDGREPDLEGQSQQPFVNPVEMGLENHDPILAIVRGDPEYVSMFAAAFGKAPEDIGMTEVSRAIASFERTIISGDSPFDRYRFGGNESAMSKAAVRGLDVFENEGRCVSCHTISQTFALFTDGRFHNLNVSFDKISGAVNELTSAFESRIAGGEDVDVLVLTDVDISELGRYP